MAAAGPQSLSTLLQRSTLDDHEELLKACNVALKKSKTDLTTQQIKVVALLKLDRYDDAARVFEEAGDNLKSKAKLEYAYTLYKTGKLQEAVELASQITGQRAARHVEAQSLYRAESFVRTSSLYEALEADNITTEARDLRINIGAVNAQVQWTGNHDAVQNKRPGREDLEAFETTYNAACGSVARGEFGQAEVLLKRAKELCKHSEDLTAEGKVAELLPINVQHLYVLERLGKLDDAKRVSSEITVENIPDFSTRRIAQNNVLIASSTPSKPSNHFLTHKLFHSTPIVPESDKLFAFQSRAYTSNAKSVDLQAFKFDGVVESTAKAISGSNTPTTSADVTTLAVLNAAARARNQTGSAALEHILPELEKRPNDVGLIVTVVQMYMLTGNITSATSLLERFLKRLDASTSENDQDVRFSPGLVAILISLYNVQGRRAHIKQELAKAAVYWRHKSKAPQSLLQAAGAALLDNPSSDEDMKAAGEIFAKLREQSPNDKAALAGLVAAKATEEHDAISSELGKLTAVSELIKGLDVAALEKAGIPQSSNALAIAQQLSSRKRPADGAQSKPKRIRKSRLPKDYEPGKTPDPERWLPLRDRSNYRPKGKKKGKKDGSDRTQGGVVADDVGVKDTTSKAPSTVIGGGGANKKKKGKAKK